MAKKSYPPEFRHKVLELVRSGRSVNAIAGEFEIARQTIMNWLKQDDIDAGRREGVTTEEQLEIRRLKKRVKDFEFERDVLKKPRRIQWVSATLRLVYLQASCIARSFSGVDLSAAQAPQAASL